MAQKTNSQPRAGTPWERMNAPVDLPYNPLPSDGSLPSAQEFKDWDKRTCGCPLPMALKKRHRALGRGAGVRLCCIARHMEKAFEMPEGSLYFWMEFEPDWEWDEQEEVQPSEGEAWVERGRPPQWLLERMVDKGIGS